MVFKECSLIRELFFAVALLVPVVAFGGDPTANLSVQVVPSGSTGNCRALSGDILSDLPSSFTTCVRYNDFTTVIPNSVGTGLANNWLNCSQADNSDPNTVWNWSWLGADPAGGALPCVSGSSANPGNSAIFQTNDPIYGNLALVMRSPSTCTGTSYGGQCGAFLQSVGYPSDVQAPNKGLFGNFYIEFEWRRSVAAPGNGGGNLAIWSYATCPESVRTGNYSGPCNTGDWGQTGTELEVDFLEEGNSSQNVDGARLFWPAGSYQNGPYCSTVSIYCSYDPTIYHKWGALLTGDGTGNYRLRWYLDGVRTFDTNAGSDWGGKFISSQSNERRLVMIWNYTNPGVSDDLFIKNIVIISCANWNQTDASGGMCNVANP